MTYDELKTIAAPHVRKHGELPSNSFLLLMQLHIPYRTEVQCRDDFKNSISPLYNTPAFLYIDSKGNKTVYFKTNTQYWNFYIFHEIAHFLLGHETRSNQNEMDADMLACILTAPVENLPSTIKTARDLSTICQIPIDKAEMYWQEIKPSKREILSSKQSIISLILCAIVIIAIMICTPNSQKPNNISTFNSGTELKTESEVKNINTVFVTESGTKYHLPDCQYVKYKTNLIEYNVNDAVNKGYQPCKTCIGR